MIKMDEKMLEVPSEDQLFQWAQGWREFDTRDSWTTEDRILRGAARCIHEAMLNNTSRENWNALLKEAENLLAIFEHETRGVTYLDQERLEAAIKAVKGD